MDWLRPRESSADQRSGFDHARIIRVGASRSRSSQTAQLVSRIAGSSAIYVVVQFFQLKLSSNKGSFSKHGAEHSENAGISGNRPAITPQK
jgi:hypothetical protein